MSREVNVSSPLMEVSGTAKPDSRPWESADPVFSAYSRDLIKTVFKCYVRQLFIFLGIPGNFVSCVVFFKQGLSDRINALLFSLAVADLTHLVTQLLYVPSCYLSDKVEINNWSAVLNTKITHVKTWSGFVSGSLVMIMSVDRCLSVVMPLKARRLLTYRSMVMAIVLSYLVPFGVYLTLFLSFDIEWKVDPTTNRSIAYQAEASWFPVSTVLAARLRYYFSLIIRPVYLVTVVVCCAITISHLRQASLQRSQMTGSASEKSDLQTNLESLKVN
ncbi:uncharacterized protein LOC143290126 [Babylonia areolata]|uniref:uncharacterized protein LOC143290126 n=1 Tax=Babylonia areolata TaxID=304850 RepID=UPI003FD0F2D5